MRLGVLDVGSNTVHLQVVETYPGARPNPTSNLKIDLRLIEFVDSSGFIRPEGIEELRSSIKSCLSEMKRAKATQLLPFATSALREAGNGSDVINLINDEFDIDLQVLSGEEEAQITFLAARRWFGWSSGRLLMIDIGGGSLELLSELMSHQIPQFLCLLAHLVLQKNFWREILLLRSQLENFETRLNLS